MVAHDAANPSMQSVQVKSSSSNRLQVGYVGGMLPGYGIDVIVSIAKANPELDMHVVGGSSEAILSWQTRAFGVRNLTFHGFVEPRSLASFYDRFDVVLAPFQRDTPSILWISPMKLFEYMAYGKAIVCSDFPIMREILSDQVTALLVPADNIGAWSAALARLADRSLREQLGRAALARLRQEHTWRHRAERVLADLP